MKDLKLTPKNYTILINQSASQILKRLGFHDLETPFYTHKNLAHSHVKDPSS